MMNLLLILLSFVSSTVAAEKIQVAVAANFNAPMKELAEIFQKDTGIEVTVIPGSSGKLYEQIRNGAPFDLFFSADQGFPNKLVTENKTTDGQSHTYAIGQLALYSKKKFPQKTSDEVLTSGTFKRLVVANPKLAPYGLAAEQYLAHLQLAEKLNPQLVNAEDIQQALQYVDTENADLGFVAFSQVVQRDQSVGTRWLIPSGKYNELKQDVVLLKQKTDRSASRKFLAFVLGKESKPITDKFGYKRPY
ncbi:MAG: molybdate ABC transporter substrate-binding protein [Bdellovibrio sp.]